MAAAQATQAPSLPDASSLAGLDPSVAIMFLGVVALGMILFYFGPALRDRMAKKPADPKPADPTSTAPIVSLLPSTTQVLDRTAEMTDRYIADLKEQIRGQRSELEDQDREIARLRAENDRLRDERRRGAP